MTVNSTEVTILPPTGHRWEPCGFPSACSLRIFLPLSTREPCPFQGSLPPPPTPWQRREAGPPEGPGAPGLWVLRAWPPWGSGQSLSQHARVLSCVFPVPSFLISVDCNLLCLIYYLNLITTLS